MGLITVYASARSGLWYVINRILSWWPDGVRRKAQGAFVEITGLIYSLFTPVQLFFFFLKGKESKKERQGKKRQNNKERRKERKQKGKSGTEELQSIRISALPQSF